MRIVRATETAHPDNTQLYRLYISQLYQLSIVGVVEAFTEEAPQVMKLVISFVGTSVLNTVLNLIAPQFA